MTTTCRSRFDLVESRRWSPTISVFFPGQINSRWPPPPPTPCRTKLIRKWRSLGEPLFRVDCTPPNGNGLLPPFRIPLPPSALSLFRGSLTHTRERERGGTTKLRAAESIYPPFYRKHRHPLLLSSLRSKKVLLDRGR